MPSTLRFLFLFLASTLALAILQAGNVHYPYFISWDMDLITAIDLIRLQEGQLPLHLNHPGIGMYLLMKPILWLSAQFGLIDVQGFQDLSEYLNPMLAIAQLVKWIHAFNPFIILGMGLATWLGLWNLFGSSGFWLGALAFGQILVSPSIWGFHLATNRTELFALFYAALAFLGLTEVLKFRGDGQSEMWRRYLFYGLLTLSLITKIQVLFILIFFLIILEIHLTKRGAIESVLARVLNSRMAMVFWGSLSVTGLIFIQIPRNYATFTKYTGPNVFFALWAIWLVCFYLELPKKIFAHPFRFLKLIWIAPRVPRLFGQQKRPLSEKPTAFFEFAWVSGFSLFLCFLLSGGVIYYFKILFLRVSDYNTVSGRIYSYMESFTWNFQYHHLLLALPVLLFLLVPKAKRDVPLIFLLFLVCLNVLIGTREGLQDAIWNELFMTWGFVFISYTYVPKKVSQIFLLLFFVAGIGVRLHSLPGTPPFMKMESAQWYSLTWRFQHTVYNEGTPQYQKVMDSEFSVWPEALQRKFFLQAESASYLLSLMEKSWISDKPRLKDIGILAHGAPFRSSGKKEIWRGKFGEKTILGFSDRGKADFFLEDNRDYWLMSREELSGSCIENSGNRMERDGSYFIYFINRTGSRIPCGVNGIEGVSIYLLTQSELQVSDG